jgi:hypothetical protein
MCTKQEQIKPKVDYRIERKEEMALYIHFSHTIWQRSAEYPHPTCPAVRRLQAPGRRHPSAMQKEHKRRDVRIFSHTTLCLIGRGRRCRYAMEMTRAQPPERSRTPDYLRAESSRMGPCNVSYVYVCMQSNTYYSRSGDVSTGGQAAQGPLPWSRPVAVSGGSVARPS